LEAFTGAINALELFYDLAIGTKTGLSVSPGLEAFTGAIAATE